MKKGILRTLGVLLLLVAAVVINIVWFRPVFKRAFYEKVFIQFALDSPELLSRLRLLEGLGIQGHNARLDDVSEAQTGSPLACARAWLPCTVTTPPGCAGRTASTTRCSTGT